MLSVRNNLTHRGMLVATGAADKVVQYHVLPPGSTLHEFQVRIDVVPLAAMEWTKGFMHGVSAYILPVPDLDSPFDTPDAAWDAMVPKDETIDSNVIDIDALTSADASPDVQVGPAVIDVNAMVGLGSPLRVFRKVFMTTFASSPSGFVTGTPGT